ncbi:Similar to T: Transposable element P transposase (Drosophila melanogaster), partial [Cotesia congregata]
IMGGCSFPNCHNSSEKGFKVMRFPRCIDIRNKWVTACKILKPINENSRLCEGHFRLEISPNENIQDCEEVFPGTSYHSNQPSDNFEKSPRELLLEQQINELLKENTALKKKVSHMAEKSTTLDTNLKKFLNPDQLLFLKSNASTNSKPWSEETIKKGLRIRLLMGTKAYKSLRDIEGFPLPAFSTLYSRLSGFNFAPGTFHSIIEWLGMKIRQQQDETAHYCVLALDEMSIHPAVEYDRGLGNFIGLVTPELARDSNEADTMASHAIAFVARGLTSHWKQLVGYALTGKSVTSKCLWNYVQEIIRELYQQDIIVKCISTDEGPTNVGMWTLNSITSSRYLINSSSQHPSNPDELLHWTSDVPHVLKRIWSQLLKTKFILSGPIVQANNLPSSEVDIAHVRQLVESQSLGGPVLVTGVTAAILDPSQFDKMHVGLAKKILSEEMGRALMFSAQTGYLPQEAMTTSWFILLCSQWYDLMVCRHKSHSLGSDESSLERVEFLQSFIESIKDLQFTTNNKWKPIQRGIILVTTTALNLRKDLVLSGKFQYLLTGCLTSSSVENLFSQIRAGGDIHPKPRQLRYRMRLVAVAQYLRVPSSASYEDDDEPYYLEFLKQKKDELRTTDDEKTLDAIEMPNSCVLSAIQEYGLYYLSGWAVFVSANGCEACETATISLEPLSN